ncbi:MAG: class I SAM-dependent methyltransferase [Nitrospinota bacterium]|nr:class I SAM-dependent methyltransferase [Nitrospinota bacterium]
MNIVKSLFDHRRSNSLAARLRRKRFALFRQLAGGLDHPIRILDVGGTAGFWEKTGFLDDEPNVSITLYNLYENPADQPQLEAVAGDARDMSRYLDGHFDIVFSNSMIEHLGEFDDQRLCANEMTRVGKRYFVQTPNRYFPIEPYFLYPYFQLYPDKLKTFLLWKANIGWYPAASWEEAWQTATSVRLMTREELARLFPQGRIVDEKYLGLVKSFTAIGGW